MRNFILIILFTLLTGFAFGQFYDDCGTAGSNIDNVAAFPHDVIGTITVAGNTDDGSYTATSLTDPKRTAFYSFTVNANGYYSISFAASGGSPASGTLSIGWDPSSGTCPAIETDDGDITDGFDITSDCVSLTSGTTYYISMALEDANEGEFTITISEYGEEECLGYHDEMIEGNNLVDNDCSQSPPANAADAGTIWTTYTVTSEGNDHITVDISTIDGTLSPANIVSVYLNDCPANGGADITGNTTCLSPGDVLYIESGNTTPAFGDYTIVIDQYDNGVANDDCVNASDEGTLTCVTPVSGNGDANACEDAENTCQPGDIGVWYTFDVSSIVSTFSFTGSEFQVFTGPDCNNLTSLGCAGDAALSNVVDAPATTYWVLVFNTGNFTVQSDDNEPANNTCGAAAALVDGVEGYNICATGEYSYCSLDATSHEVYYTYTNTNTNTVDLDITVNNSTGSTGTSAGAVSVAVITDACDGTSFNGMAPVCNTLDNQFNIGCIDPNETIILIIGSAEGDEGDFSISVTENVTSVVNDVCAGATDLGVLASSCQQVDNAADNTGACSDNYNDGGCDFTGNNMHSIWYEFTTDADAKLLDITTDLTNATFALYTGPDCDNLSYESNSCTSGGTDLTGFPVAPNTTYYLLIGSDTEAPFNIGITIKNIPDNNLCADAEILVDGIDGTNACADAEFGGNCSLDANSSHEVYYTYTNTSGANVDLEVTIDGNTNTTGNAATGISVLVFTDCTGTLYNNTNEFCNTLGTQFTIECIEDGETIYLLFGSVDSEEGDFGISVNEVVSTVANDECTGAEELTYTPCAWDTYTGTNEFACFEDFTAGACSYDTDPVVWYKFTATADATSVEFDNFTTQGDGFMGLFDDTGDCDNPIEADGANGSACMSGGSGPFGPFDITGGNTYLIAVGSSNGEGNISFDMKVNETPVHDDPCAAGFDPVDLTDGVTFTDDNTCAGPDYTRCNVDNTTGKTLFYEHTMTQDADLEITVNGITATGPFTISTYEGSANCNDESNFIQEDCNNNTTTLLCRLAGENIVIMIGTSETAGEFGEYDITVTENVVARPVNDICTDAEDITYLDADLCKWVGADNNESNINACSEDNDFGTSCDYSHEEVVWYSFTTPPTTDPGSQLSIRFTGYDGTGELFATLFDDGADCTALTAVGACANGNGPNGLGNVDPNTTYLIGVGSTGDDGGNYELEIKITSGPPNDDACADMTNFTLSDGTTLIDQTNACSGAGVSFPECSTDDQTNAVFYNFTITAPVYGINIRITASGSDPIQGTVVAGISGVGTDFCSGNTYTPPGYCEDISAAEFEWTCLEEGDYQLQISTSDPNSGTFEIFSTFIDKPSTSCNQNDLCEDAIELDVSEECAWVDFIKQCNNDACPDNITVGSCDLSQGPTVWFKVLIPTGASSLDVELDNSEFSDPVMTVLDDCPPNASGDCATSSSNGATLDNPIDVTGQDGNYYYIAVSDPSGGNGGVFDLHIKIDVPPINDDPCMADPRPPYDLGISGSHTGTTCCAVGYNDDPNADLQNQGCSSASDDNAVWYRAEFDSGNSDGVNINVTGGTIGDNVAVEVFVGPDDACTGFEYRKSKCDGLPVEDMHIGCLEDGDYVWIKVTSSDGDCGTFTITVDNIKDCDVADACEDITGGQTLDPVTPDDVSFDWVCTNGCLDLACPDGIGGGCDFSQNPTVWFQVNTDNNAAQLYTQVTTSGNWTPIWSVWHPEPDCDNLANAGNFAGSFPCSSQSTPPDLLIVPVAENETYYISITADPNGEPIDDPAFELCVATIKNVVVCLGDDLGCAPDPSLAWEVTNRENTDAEPDGPPYMGPFCPGEELTVHLTFHYDATETGDDWLIGLIPKFGCGWNTDGFDYNANAPFGNGRTAEWYTEDGDCPPQMMENVGHLCTYTDADGHLRLVNQFCETIPDGVTCSDGLNKFDPLPSGYFWVQEGGSPDCDANNCSPSRKYGIGTSVVDITWDFTMTVKEFDNRDDCLDCNDLSIIFQTFSDGAAGCWDDPVAECLIDKPQWSPQWQVNCQIPPGVVAEPQPQEICTGGEVGILVYTDDGSQETIEITYDDNPNVSGESDHTFDGGSGTIDDVLIIDDDDACDPETVTYYAQVVMDGMICEGKIDTIEVTVYPLPKIIQENVFGACFEDLPYELPIESDCGYPGVNTYSWSDDISGNTGTGESIIIDQSFGVGLHTFTITVTDELGCENTGEMQFNVYPPVVFKLQGDTLCWKEEHVFVPDVQDKYGYGNFSYDWYWNPGDGFAGDDAFYEILEEEYITTYHPGEYKLCLTVSQEHDDGIICLHDTCVDVWIRKPFNLNLDPDPVYLCEGQNCVDVNIIFDEDNGLKQEEVESIVWNGDETNEPFFEFCDPSILNDVLITDIYGCDTLIEFDVLANPITDLEFSGDTVICAGDQTTLTVLGDFVSYQWNTGDTTVSISVSPDVETTYIVSAQNSSGCISSGSVTVHVYTAEIPNIPDTVSFCTGFSTTVIAPSGYSSYEWYFNSVSGSPVSNIDTVVISAAGNYILVVQTDIGCQAQDTVVAIEDDKLTPSVVGDTLLCFEEDSTLFYAIGGNFIIYQWRHDNASGEKVNTDLSQDSVYLSDGTYYLYVSDGNCDGEITFTINRKPKIEPHILPDVDTIKICYGEDTTLIAPPGYVSYQWSTGSFNDTINNVGKGNYYVTVTDDDGCQGIDSIYVYAFPRLYPSLGDSVELCAGDEAWLSPGEFTDYIWYKDGNHLAAFDGMDSILISDGGIYSVDVFNEIGCMASDSIPVKKTDNLTPGILGIEDLCDDDMIILRSTGNYFKYTWTNSDGKVLSTADTLVFVMTLGKDVETVTLTVESETGCTGTVSGTINRSHTPVLELNSELLEVCGSGSTDPDVLNFNDYFVQGSAADGIWRDFDNSNITHNADWSSADFSTVTPGTTYRYVFTTTIANSPCENVSDTLYINVIECSCDNWSILPFDDVCNDATSPEFNMNLNIIDANGNRIAPPPAGSWTVTGGPSSVLNGIYFDPANAPSGTYTLTYTFNDKGTYCSDSHEATVNVQNAVAAGQPLPFSICEGTDVLIRLDSMLVGEDPGGVWTEVSSVPSTGNVFDAAAGTFSTAGQIAGTYIFNYYLDAVDPCPDADVDVTIIIDPNPVADAGPDINVCYEEKPVTLYAQSESTNYEWRKEGSDQIIGQSRSLDVNESGAYSLTIRTAAGCFDEDVVNVVIKDDILVDIQGEILLQNGASDTLKTVVTGRTSDEIRIYNWTVNGVPVDSVHENWFYVSEAGTYCVEVEDNDGCTGNACHTVNVAITKEIDIPNIFTPDGDGKNDQFFIKDGQNVKFIRTFRIYDRWGELVYSSENFDFTDRFKHFWDGTFRGKKALPGVYVYVVEFTWNDEKEDTVSGDVTLIR